MLTYNQALIMSNASTPTHFKHNKALKLSTHGIIFCGVPHQGGNGASLGKVMLNIPSVAAYTTTKMVRILEPDDEVLRTQRDSYTFISDDFYTVPLFETQPTPIGMGMTKLVRTILLLCTHYWRADTHLDCSSRLCRLAWPNRPEILSAYWYGREEP